MIKHWESWTEKRLKLEWIKAMLQPWHFLTTFIYTTDPHDADQPIKLYPPKSYLEFLVKTWYLVVSQGDRKLLTPKSRQLLLSWTACALGLWDVISSKGGRFGYVQSAKEEKADKLVQRIQFMHKMLPDLAPVAIYTYCRMKFPGIDSSIEGVPQGPDAIRQETASWIISDEQAFQEQAEKAFTAAKPTIDGGGWYWGISTSNGPEFFKRMVFDEQG